MPTMKVKKGDLVQMLAGKDRGKQGRVIDARPSERKVIVENLNVATRHQKPRPIRDANRMGQAQVAPGGRIEKPAAVPVGNVMVICPTSKAPLIHDGLPTSRLLGPNVVRTACCRISDRPQVASSVSSGRP